jgi:dihydroorotate dehydrogenase
MSEINIKIGNLCFPKVICAPGTFGFFGEGYPFHKYLKYIPGFSQNVVFAAKTVTAHSREGNMPMKKDNITPLSLFPKCVYVDFFKGHVINAVGLTNKGIDWTMQKNNWQKRDDNYFISFMSVVPDLEDKITELRYFCNAISTLNNNFAVQINFACPNTGQDPVKFLQMVIPMLEEARKLLDVPIVANFNPFVPIQLLQDIQEKKLADAFWIANTIPYGTQSKQEHHFYEEPIDWSIFGTQSPLIKRGLEQPGGLSSHLVLPFVIKTIRAAKDNGITIPIIAGNGIQCEKSAKDLLKYSDAIAIGTVFMLRPWRIKSILKLA